MPKDTNKTLYTVINLNGSVDFIPATNVVLVKKKARNKKRKPVLVIPTDKTPEELPEDSEQSE